MGPIRLMVAGCVALIVPVALYQLAGGASWKTDQDQVETFIAQADRRNHFIEGWRDAQGFISWVDYYYFENWRLPDSIGDLHFGLPKPHDIGPTAFSFDSADGSVTMFFEGREGIEDGEVSFTPSIDEEKNKLVWECWTPDYRRIQRDLPSCQYEAP